MRQTQMTNTKESMIDFIAAAKKRLKESGESLIPQTLEEIESDRIAELNDFHRDLNDFSPEDLASWIAEIKAENA